MNVCALAKIMFKQFLVRIFAKTIQIDGKLIIM